MKNLSKTILSVLAVSTVLATMAMSAMANDFTSTYDGETGKITLEGVESTGDSQTILVINDNADVIDVVNGMIVHVDQKDDGQSYTEVTVDKTKIDLENTKYYVRICGTTGTIQTSTFGADIYGTHRITVGDVNLDEAVNSSDLAMIARHLIGKTDNIGKIGEEYHDVEGDRYITVGDMDLDGTVETFDGVYLARYVAGIRDAEYIKNVGETLIDLKKEPAPVN